jgi:gamma-glutamylcyclotransferase (GGCT)/AIG2-like uncharacterized protein YtfP
MNNFERLIWVSVLVLVGFFCTNLLNKIGTLELMQDQYRLTSSVKTDQILDLMNELDSSKESQYQSGYLNGQQHAMIASIKGEHIYDYADGYHAALDQFGKQEKDAEVYKLFHQALDLLDESDKNYNHLLETVGTPKNGN